MQTLFQGIEIVFNSPLKLGEVVAQRKVIALLSYGLSEFVLVFGHGILAELHLDVKAVVSIAGDAQE